MANLIGGIRDAQGNSPRRRRRTIRSSRCTRCWIALASSAAMSKSWAQPAPHGRDVLVSEAMRPSNATAQWHRRLAQPEIVGKISRGMTNLAVIEAANPEMEALAIAVAMREARHLNKSAALVTPDRALARRVIGGARPLESRIRRFRRRRADGHAGGNFRAARRRSRRRSGWSRRPCWRCSSIRCSGSAARRAHSRGAVDVLELALLRGTRPQAGKQVAWSRDFDALPHRTLQAPRGETSSLHRSEPRAGFERRATRSGGSADRASAKKRFRRWKASARQSRMISPNWRNAIATP